MDSPHCRIESDSPEWAFRRLMHAHHTAHNAIFDSWELKDVGQPILLFLLSDMKRTGRAVTQSDLCEALNRSPSTITISVNSLERHGYIRRIADEADKRRKYVEITPEGELAAEKCRRAVDYLDGAMFDGFDEAQKKQITELFNRICVNLLSLTDRESEVKDIGQTL